MPDVGRVPAEAVAAAAHDAVHARGRRRAAVRRRATGASQIRVAHHRADGRDRRARSRPTTSSSPPARSRRSTCSRRCSSTPATSSSPRARRTSARCRRSRRTSPTSAASRWTTTACAWTCSRPSSSGSARAAPSSSTRSRTSRTPAGVTLSPERRRRLLELAREYDIPVVEDDPYGRLRFEGGHMKPLRALDDEVIYLGTFSKIFAPGLRLGLDDRAPADPRQGAARRSRPPTCAARNFAQVDGRALLPGHALAQGARRASRARTPSVATRCSPRSRSTSRPRRAGPTPRAASSSGSSCPRFVDTQPMLAEAVEHGVTFAPGDGVLPGRRGARTACGWRSATLSRRRSPRASGGSPRSRGPARAVPRVHRGGRARAEEGAA